uniref:ZP domain-containing protein n=1 Tax=Syphacia muris TaxID=451379 RepID=A0A0N5A9Y0_9BILA
MVVDVGAECNITMEITSETSKPVLLKVVFYNGTQTPWTNLKHSGSTVTYHLHDSTCGRKPTELRARLAQDKASKKYQTSSSFIDGSGSVSYKVLNGIFGPYPKMKSRFGILCAFGDCGRRR